MHKAQSHKDTSENNSKRHQSTTEVGQVCSCLPMLRHVMINQLDVTRIDYSIVLICRIYLAVRDGRYQHIQNRYNTKYLTTWYRYYRYRNDTIPDVGGTTNTYLITNVKQPKCMILNYQYVREFRLLTCVRGQKPTGITRKRKRLIGFGLILFLFADTNSPAFKKSHSDGTDVLGTHKCFIARCCSWGYWLPFLLPPQKRGLPFSQCSFALSTGVSPP